MASRAVVWRPYSNTQNDFSIEANAVPTPAKINA